MLLSMSYTCKLMLRHLFTELKAFLTEALKLKLENANFNSFHGRKNILTRKRRPFNFKWAYHGDGIVGCLEVLQKQQNVFSFLNLWLQLKCFCPTQPPTGSVFKSQQRLQMFFYFFWFFCFEHVLAPLQIENYTLLENKSCKKWLNLTDLAQKGS